MLATLLGVVVLVPPAAARGIYFEPAPWYSSTFSDTLLALEVGAAYAKADTHDTTVFPLVLGTVRRGPVQFAGRWSFISMRGSTAHRSDFGDLKIYGRMRLPVFRDSTDVLRPNLWISMSARIGLAKPELYPFATGGQEIEAGGVFAWPRAAQAVLGVGRVWSEPPRDAVFTSLDVPHSTHCFLQVRATRRQFDLQLRSDVFVTQVKGLTRSQWTASVVRRSVEGFHLVLEYSVETGNASEHVFDHLFSVRLATRLR